MAEDTADEDRQFEQVLNRLDALMKRSHAPLPEDHSEMDAAEAALPDVPVLTEIYCGPELLSVVVEEQTVPPLLTELVSAPLPVVIEAVVPEPELPKQPQLSREQEVESVVAELMPKLRERIASVVQEEFFYAQQNLSLRISQEAERVLRLRLLQETKPK